MSWDDEAKTWDDEPAVRAYAAAAHRSLLAVCAERGISLEGLRVLDFGCGTGLLTERLAPHARQVVALDRSAAMVAVLRRKIGQRGLLDVTPVVGDLATGDHSALRGPFDLVVASSVCAFVNDYPATVRDLAARLAPSGLLVQWDWELDPSADEPFGLSRESIRAAYEAAGLVDVEVGTGFSEPFEDMRMEPVRGVGRQPGRG